MKSRTSIHLVLLTLLGLTLRGLGASPELPGRAPILDAQGRFWVYHNGLAHPHMPFAPYGWMSDGTNLTQIIQVDLESTDKPNNSLQTSGASENEACIHVKLTWGEASWASVAFISGPDKPAWWGETNRGRYFNLGALAKKKLVFYARGERGGEAIKIQVGMLCTKPFGDSLSKPIVSEEMKLTRDWLRHEIDLKDFPPNELSHICNGFGVAVERNSQPGSSDDTQFYLDDIYFE